MTKTMLASSLEPFLAINMLVSLAVDAWFVHFQNGKKRCYSNTFLKSFLTERGAGKNKY